MRRFEKISVNQFRKDFKDNSMYESVKIPVRKTLQSAGYDFYMPFDFILKPGEIIKIPTGIKVAMEKDEFLMIVVRSSIGFKYNVRMCNQVGIIDYDYYNNSENEGHIWIAFQNEGTSDWSVSVGDRVVQGIFVKYLLADDEHTVSTTRNGGLGSTN